jgi:hypothetical protein
MRNGNNPTKNLNLSKDYYNHQVITTIYTPKLGRYFKDWFTILKYYLKSLLFTSHSQTYFIIVNNCSCGEVGDYLVGLKCKQQFTNWFILA